jgi:hypothetical protein
VAHPLMRGGSCPLLLPSPNCVVINERRDRLKCLGHKSNDEQRGNE